MGPHWRFCPNLVPSLPRALLQRHESEAKTVLEEVDTQNTAKVCRLHAHTMSTGGVRCCNAGLCTSVCAREHWGAHMPSLNQSVPKGAWSGLNVTLAQARVECQLQGAALCSPGVAATGIRCRTGCKMDSKSVWLEDGRLEQGCTPAHHRRILARPPPSPPPLSPSSTLASTQPSSTLTSMSSSWDSGTRCANRKPAFDSAREAQCEALAPPARSTQSCGARCNSLQRASSCSRPAGSPKAATAATMIALQARPTRMTRRRCSHMRFPKLLLRHCWNVYPAVASSSSVIQSRCRWWNRQHVCSTGWQLRRIQKHGISVPHLPVRVSRLIKHTCTI